ncbi:hypothetical protein GCM10027169_24240 [Gordonia jinhuaensis]
MFTRGVAQPRHHLGDPPTSRRVRVVEIAERGALMNRDIAVLHRQCRQPGRDAGATRAVGGEQVGDEYIGTRGVGGNVMDGEYHHRTPAVILDHLHAQWRLLGEIPPSTEEFGRLLDDGRSADALLLRTIGAAGGVMECGGDRHGDGGFHTSARSVGEGVIGGAQHLMPGEHVGESRSQRIMVDPLLDPHGQRHRVRRGVRIDLREDPQPLLRQRQRYPVGTVITAHTGTGGDRGV